MILSIWLDFIPKETLSAFFCFCFWRHIRFNVEREISSTVRGVSLFTRFDGIYG